MSTTDCINLRREIDGSSPGRLRSAFAKRHIGDCPECKSFTEQTVKLQEILSSLGTVEAPGDFDFRLRARLAGEKPASSRFSLSGFSFGLKGAAFAALTLMFGSILFFSLRNPSPLAPLSANNKTPASTAQPGPVAFSAVPAGVKATDVKEAQSAIETANSNPHRSRTNSQTLASNRGNSRMGTRDMGSRPATTIKAADLNAQAADFPIGSSTQPVKVSLDNGRGNSRTISLPPVSFGSQRVLSQGSAPLLASARGSW